MQHCGWAWLARSPNHLFRTQYSQYPRQTPWHRFPENKKEICSGSGEPEWKYGCCWIDKALFDIVLQCPYHFLIREPHMTSGAQCCNTCINFQKMLTLFHRVYRTNLYKREVKETRKVSRGSNSIHSSQLQGGSSYYEQIWWLFVTSA